MNKTKIPLTPKILLALLLASPFIGGLILVIKGALLQPYQTAPSVTPDSPILQLAFMAMVLLPFLLISIGELYIGKRKLAKQDFTSANRLFRGSSVLSTVGIILVGLITIAF